MRTRRTVALGHVALLLVASGCAARTVRPSIPDDIRAGLGTVAVIPSAERPEWSFAYPVPSRAGAALTGAGAALGLGAAGGAACLAYFAPGCLLALWTPVMVVTNGVEGAVKGAPVADVWSSAAALRTAASEPDLSIRLAERVASGAQSRAGEARIRFATNGLPDRGKADYAALSAEGVDTVLEVQLERLQLKRTSSGRSTYGPSVISIEGLINAPLEFTIVARVRVLRASDGVVLYKTAFDYRTASQKFTDWGRDGAAQFRDERDRALESIAREIVRDIFGPEPAREPEQARPEPAQLEAQPEPTTTPQ
jgi:hypothetical protein